MALRTLSNVNHSYSSRIQSSSLLTFVVVSKEPECPALYTTPSPQLLSLNRKGLWCPLLPGSGTVVPRAESSGLLAVHGKVLTSHRAEGKQVKGDFMPTEMGVTEGCQARLW